MKLDFELNYTAEARRMMDERMILTDDVIAVLEDFRRSGEAIDDEDGLLVARRRVGNATFWVKFSPGRRGFLYGPPGLQSSHERGQTGGLKDGCGEELLYHRPPGQAQCVKCGVPLEKGKAKFMYLDNGFPVELPVCPVCGFVYVPEELALGKVASVERALEDK